MSSTPLGVHRTKARRARFALLTTTAALLLSILSAGFGSTAQAADPVPKPLFSQNHGFFDSSFQLALTPAATAPAGTTIRYTTNGATPTASSGTLYSAPITISATTPIRAVAISAGVASEIVAKTYIFLDGVRTQSNTQAGYPTVFAAPDADDESPGPYPADYAMDPEVVNHYSTSTINNALKAIPTMAITTDIKNLFDPATGVYYNPNEKGSAWERPVSVEWIDPTGATTGFSTNAGIRIHGQASRRPWNTPKKSMRLYFKASYGNGKLEFPLFEGHGEASQPVEVFDRLILRNGGNRSFHYYDRDQRREADYANDEWAREAFLDMGHLTPHGTYVHLYINGLYWGLYDTTERIDEKFYASYLGGDPDTDFDVISADEDLDNAPVAEVGDLITYNSVLTALGTSGNVSNATYQSLQTKLDMVSLADYLILTHYIGKTDWPNHNWDVYRQRTGSDQRLKFSTWDNDSGLWKVDENTTKRNDHPELDQTPAQMFWRLITNPEFKQLVADRVQLNVLNNGPLSPAKCATRYSALTDEIDQAIIGESARWGDYSRDVYQNNAEKAGPAYLYTRDFTDAQSDPANAVDDSQQKNWTEVRAEKLGTYCPQRADVFIGQYKTNGWYFDTVKAPTLTKYGGDVTAGTTVTIGNPNTSAAGDILYTTNGTDPRAFGGSDAAGVLNGADSKVVTIDATTTIKARVKNGTSWSNLIDYTFTVGGTPPPANVAPTTSVTAPANDSTATVGTPVTITANAADSDGTIANVVFTADNTPIAGCTDTTAPYTCSWTPSSAGAVALRSVATDDDNAPTTSAAVNVTVTAAPPPSGTGDFVESRGKVSIEAESFGSKTARSSHEWVSASSPTGFSGASVMTTTPNDGAFIKTKIPANSPVMTYPVKFSTTGTYNVWVRGYGANASANSVHVGLDNTVAASPSIKTGAYRWVKAGTIAVSAAGTRSFNAWMREDGTLVDKFLLTKATSTPAGVGPAESPRDGGGPPPANVAPSVTLTAPATGTEYVLDGPVTVTADAADTDGTVSKVEFASNGAAISGCTDTTTPYSCTFTPSAVGTYALTAVATDDDAAMTASVARSVTVDGASPPPTPVGGTYVEAGGVIAMEVERGTVTTVGGKTWTPTTTPTGTAGTGALISGPNTGVTISSNPATASPSATLAMEVSSAGSYTVWVRAVGPTGSADSIYLGADNIPGSSVAVRSTSWFWKKAGTVNLTAGPHSYSVWMREDGASVDRILLTRATTTPTGTGPAESTRTP